MDLVDYTVLEVMLAILRALSAPGLWAAAVVSSLDLGVVDDSFRITYDPTEFMLVKQAD